MRAIQGHLPAPRLVELHRVLVKADPATAWAAARHFDGAAIPWVRLLFDLRELPARLLHGAAPEADRRIGVDQVVAAGHGFMVLEERPGHEVVVGAVGRFWHSRIPFADVTPATFASFTTPGWAKVAWAIAVEPHGTGSAITFEVRVTATDEDSWKHLRRYFQLIGPASRLIRASVMAHLEAELGPQPPAHDPGRPLPGDELVSDALYSLTHAGDIEAPPALVWPWLMQLGCDRGGWYSIDALDHGGAPSTDHLVRGWETRAVGDRLAATMALNSYYEVQLVDPPRCFAIGGETDRLGSHVKMSWAFVLEPLGEDATHLVTRVRARAAPRWAEWLQGAVLFPPIHAVMQHTQLHNLKRLAEREAQGRPR